MERRLDPDELETKKEKRPLESSTEAVANHEHYSWAFRVSLNKIYKGGLIVLRYNSAPI